MREIRSVVEVLSSGEVGVIHASALRILGCTGFEVPLQECLLLCREYGAEVDLESQRVRLPGGVVEKMLDQMKSSFSNRAVLRSPRRFEGMISTQVFVVDYANRSRRKADLDDLLKGIAIVEQLDQFPTSNAVVLPGDIAAPIMDIVAFQMVYAYSRKPGGTYILTPESGEYILEMARVMNRQVRFFLEPVTPLRFREESLRTALLYAKNGQPFYVGPMVMGGATGPVTLAGILTLHTAELLASLFLVYTLTGTFEVQLYNSGPHTVEPRNMLCSFGSPNQALLGIATVQIERYYGLEPACNTGLTDALSLDFQAGFEKAASAIFSFLAGARSIGCQGLAGADQGFSFEQLILDNEWLKALNYVLEGMEVSEKTIACDLIENVGPGGNFVAEPHTVENMRKNYFPSRLFSREDWENWKKKGAPDLLAKAHEMVESLAHGYEERNPVCTPSQFEKMNEIVEAARKHLLL